MFVSDYLNKHATKQLIKRFLSAFVGSGKTMCIMDRAKKLSENGEKVVIVSNHTWVLKNDLPKGVTLLHMEKVLKELKKYSVEDNLETICDPYFVPRKFLKCFEDYDKVLIDPACFEEIIIFLLDKLSSQQKLIDKLKNSWKEY